MTYRPLTILLLMTFCVSHCAAQNDFVPNYDEAKVPSYELPDPLVSEAGKPVATAQQWNQTRRPELVQLFRDHVYGNSPAPCVVRSKEVSRVDDAAGGTAIRREVDVFFGAGDDAPSMRLLVYTPESTSHPVPAFLGLNFQGNHSIEPDDRISIPTSWMRDRRNGTTEGNVATAEGRGVAASRWSVQAITQRGYGLVTIYYGDIDPDFDDGFENGIHAEFKKWNQSVAPKRRWGSIAAWAYGLSRALDYLETDPSIDATKVAVLGHSRLGKTALWAGASDPRFAIVISNNSGCGGAALSRRAVGETVGRINTSFPHWFCDQFATYNQNESACPVDQHQLIALVAPRPVYVASASEDKWADPRGEFLATVHAEPVYRLLGTEGFGPSGIPEMPRVNSPTRDGVIGYHLRDGKHDLTDYDWQQYLSFADRFLKP